VKTGILDTEMWKELKADELQVSSHEVGVQYKLKTLDFFVSLSRQNQKRLEICSRPNQITIFLSIVILVRNLYQLWWRS